MPDDPASQQTNIPEESQRRGQLVLRSLPVLLIPVFSALVAFMLMRVTMQAMPSRLPEASSAHGFVIVPIIVTAVFFTALIVLVRLGRPTTSALLLIGAWTLITTLVTLRGGMASIGPAFLIIPIVASGLLIDGVASTSLAALATLMVISVGWLETRGLYAVLEPQLTLSNGVFPIPGFALFMACVWAGLYWTVALLTSLLAGGLQRSLKQSREQAQALRDLSNQLEARVAAQTAELAQRTARAEALYEVSRALTSTLDLNQVLALITEQAARLLGFESAQVLLQQADGSFVSVGAYGQPGNPTEQGAVLGPMLRDVGERREARVVHLPLSIQATDQPAGTTLLLPMRYSTRVTGVLMLTNAGGHTACGTDDLILGQDLADQAAVAIANAQLLNQARETATLEERTRLARDIHDTLAQGLTGVVVQLGAALRAQVVAPQDIQQHLILAQNMARESLAEARRSVWNLRAPALVRGDLGDALKALTLRPLDEHATVTFAQQGESWALSSTVESTLLRVCQEALSNVAKHAQATAANVVLEYGVGHVRLSIQDNGIGIDEQVLIPVTAQPGPWAGFGLVGMRERVRALGGTLEITSEEGTHVMAVIPRSGEPLAHASERHPADAAGEVVT